MFEIFFKMLIGHAIADFALQTDTMAKGKNRNNKTDCVTVGKRFMPGWQMWLTSHALINGCAVWIATNVAELGVAESISHWLIDYAKCEKWINSNTDQALHMVCKVAWLCCLAMRST